MDAWTLRRYDCVRMINEPMHEELLWGLKRLHEAIRCMGMHMNVKMLKRT